MSLELRVREAIRDIPDFPKPGIMFKDITPIMEDPLLSYDLVEHFSNELAHLKVDAIAGVESRGFLYGMPLAMRMQVPFITVRKKGKLPYTTVSHSYDLEYGSAEIEMHVDVIQKDWNVLVHDDLLATGGTAAATAELIKKQGAHVSGFCFLVELSFLRGEDKIRPYSDKIINIVSY